MTNEEMFEELGRILVRDRSVRRNLSKNMDTDIADIIAVFRKFGWESPEEIKVRDDKLILTRAEAAGCASLLLDVQKECVELRKVLTEAKDRYGNYDPFWSIKVRKVLEG